MEFHLAAVLIRKRRVIKIGVNSYKTHPKFPRTYRCGNMGWNLHAEMDALRYAQPGDKLMVLRFSAKGGLTCGKPCPVCMKYIKEAKISQVYYSDWDGTMKNFDVEDS